MNAITKDEMLKMHNEVMRTLDVLHHDILKLDENRRKIKEEPLVSNRELAQMLDVKPPQLKRYRDWGWLEAVIIQRRVFYKISVAKQFMERMTSGYFIAKSKK